jgi:hypothetical protein
MPAEAGAAEPDGRVVADGVTRGVLADAACDAAASRKEEEETLVA